MNSSFTLSLGAILCFSGATVGANQTKISDCPNYPLGLSRAEIAGEYVNIAVERSKLLGDSFDSLLKAKELTVMKGKSQIAYKEGQFALAGVTVLFECVKDDFIYVGVSKGVKSKQSADHMGRIIKESIKRTPVSK